MISTRFCGRLLCVCSFSLAGCSADKASSSLTSNAAPSVPAPAGAGGGGGTGSGGAPMSAGTGGGLVIVAPPAAGTTGDAPERPAMTLTNVTATEVGGYQLGDEILDGAASETNTSVDANDGCGVLVGVARDFKTTEPGKHPDFESFSGQVVVKGLVGPELDANRKPVYASHCELMPDTTLCPTGQQTTSQVAFDQWYRNTPDVNHAYLLYFQLQPTGNVVSFQSENFVPLDNAGFNDTWPALDGKQHNYGFTTELHVKFKYSGGESFTFKGDDDVWAFINGHLAIDLGGLHEARADTIALDDRAAELGIEKGNVYPLELFQAERHSSGSHFRIDSTLSLVDCGSIPKPPK